jgi:enoyl-CoA hydratase/carnithine racemase
MHARLCEQAHRLQKPLVAAVQGVAIEGMTMLTHWDFVYAGEKLDARARYPICTALDLALFATLSFFKHR